MALEENDLVGLSAEEIAAIQDDGEEAEALKEVANESDETDNVDDQGDDNADQDADAVETDAENEEANEEKAFVPTQAVISVEDFDNKIADFKTAKSDLRAQLNNGDIDLDTYETKKDEIAEQETALKIQQANAINALQQNEFAAKQRWEWEQDQFFKAKANTIYSDDIISAALNAAVKKLANDPKYAQKDGMFFLNEADKIVRHRFGLSKDGTGKEAPSRRPDLSKIPKTLGDLPNAAVDDTNDGEFAHLDKLEGMDLERAIAKISESPEKLERYLRA